MREPFRKAHAAPWKDLSDAMSELGLFSDECTAKLLEGASPAHPQHGQPDFAAMTRKLQNGLEARACEYLKAAFEKVPWFKKAVQKKRGDLSADVVDWPISQDDIDFLLLDFARPHLCETIP